MELHDSETPCVGCGGTRFGFTISAADFDTGMETYYLEECAGCRLTRTSPRPTASDLQRSYDNDYYGSGGQKFTGAIEAWTRFVAARQAAGMLRAIHAHAPGSATGARVLDVGCGRGLLLRALADAGCRCTGLERPDFPGDIWAGAAEIIREDLMDHDFGPARFNLIILRHVLEHLEDPRAALVRVRDLLADDGVVWIDVPNLGSIQAQLFGRKWFHLDLPRHLYHFTPATLRALLRDSGLRAARLNTFSLDQSVYGFIQSALNATGVFGVNTLYHRLKHSADAAGARLVPLQLMLAAALSPVALVDYAVSGLVDHGSCIGIQAMKST